MRIRQRRGCVVATQIRVALATGRGHNRRTAMGPFPHDAPATRHLRREPDGHRRVRVRRVLPSRTGRARRAVHRRWASRAVAKHRSKDVTLYRQGDINFIVNAEPGSFAERFAERARALAPAPWRSGSSMPNTPIERALSLGRQAGARRRSARWNSNIPAIEGIGGLPDLPRRPLRREGLDLRRRFRVARRARSEARRRRPLLHRPPDPQRPARPPERMGRLLRAPLQLPPDPLLRHRGQA